MPEAIKTGNDAGCGVELSEELIQDHTEKLLQEEEKLLGKFPDGKEKDNAQEEFKELQTKAEEAKKIITEETCNDLDALKALLQPDIKEFREDIDGMTNLKNFRSTDIEHLVVDGKNGIAVIKKWILEGGIQDEQLEEDIFKVFEKPAKVHKFLEQYKDENKKPYPLPVDPDELREFISLVSFGPKKTNKPALGQAATKDTPLAEKKEEESSSIYEKEKILVEELAEENLPSLTPNEMKQKLKELKVIYKKLCKGKTPDQKKLYKNKFKNILGSIGNYIKRREINRNRVIQSAIDGGVKPEDAEKLYHEKTDDAKKDGEGTYLAGKEGMNIKIEKSKKYLGGLSKLEANGVALDEEVIERLKVKFGSLSQKIDSISIEDTDAINKYNNDFIEAKKELNEKFPKTEIVKILADVRKDEEEKAVEEQEKAEKQVCAENEKCMTAACGAAGTVPATQQAATRTLDQPAVNSSKYQPKYEKYTAIWNAFDGEMTGEIQHRLRTSGATHPDELKKTPITAKREIPTVRDIIAKKAFGDEVTDKSKRAPDGGILNATRDTKINFGENGEIEISAYDKKTGHSVPINMDAAISTDIKSKTLAYTRDTSKLQGEIGSAEIEVEQIKEQLKNDTLTGEKKKDLESKLVEKEDEILEKKEKLEEKVAKFTEVVLESINNEALNEAKTRAKNISLVMQQLGFSFFSEPDKKRIFALMEDPFVNVNIAGLHRGNFDEVEGKYGARIADGDTEHLEMLVRIRNKVFTGKETPEEGTAGDILDYTDFTKHNLSDTEFKINNSQPIVALRGSLTSGDNPVLSKSGIMNIDQIIENLEADEAEEDGLIMV